MPTGQRFLILAASLVAMPLAGALAQSNPTGNLGSNTSSTASPGTADDKAVSGLETGDAKAKHARPVRMARNPSTSKPTDSTPGATGRTIVRGDSSTIQGDAAATAQQKTPLTK